jgi:parallel beta-helix repeat protein
MTARPPTSVASLLESLRDLEILSAAQLEELGHGQAATVTEPRALTDDLVRRGWVTPFQAEQLLRGQGQELRLDCYLVLDRLGAGGMGEVFKARDGKMGRVVALKVIRRERLSSPQTVRRFLREVEAHARLEHPNIVRAYRADRAGETHFLVMEYVAGMNLAQLVQDRRPLPVPLACDHARQAALGLQHAHEFGMVHRDIKPGNLLASLNGVVKILDFGLALLGPLHESSTALSASTSTTYDGQLLGTPDFMAPEQARDAHGADIRSDVYSLGCTLYFLLTGRPPYARGSLLEKLRQHEEGEPLAVELLRPDVPDALARVVRKMMAKKPADRYQTPAEAAAALEPFCQIAAQSGPVPLSEEVPLDTAEFLNAATPTSVTPAPPRSRSSRRRRLLTAGAVSLGLLVPLLAWWFWPRAGTSPDRTTPQPGAIVSLEGDGDYRSINEAIQKGGPGRPILVRPGTYKESIVIDREVEIRGDGFDVHVEAAGASCLVMKADSAKVSGLTLHSKPGPESEKAPAVRVSHGRLTLAHCDIASDSDSCVIVHEATTSLTLFKCKVHNGKMAGVYLHRGSQGTFEECDISDNHVGVVIRERSNPLLRKCRVTNNQTFGVFVYEKGQGTIEADTVISGSWAEGVAIQDEGSELVLRKCKILQGGSVGVLITKAGSGEAYECTIRGNAAGGVAVSDKGSKAVVKDCLIMGNRNLRFVADLDRNPGVIVANGSSARIEGCDLTGNAGGDLFVEPGCEVIDLKNRKK